MIVLCRKYRYILRFVWSLIIIVMGTIGGLAQSGTADPTFQTNVFYDFPDWTTSFVTTVRTTVLQPDGKTLVGGDFMGAGGLPHRNLARLNPDGSGDSSFNIGAGADNSVHTVALQADGKIIVGGLFFSINNTTRYFVTRLNADGTLDTTFNTGSGPSGPVYAAIVQPNGKILIAGEFTSVNGVTRNFLARLNANGSLDTSFNPGTGPNGFVLTMALQSNGRIVITGNFTQVGTQPRYTIARLNANGSLDTTFLPGIVPSGGGVAGAAIQSNGKVVIGGEFTAYNGSTLLTGIARLNSNGSVDTTFVGPGEQVLLRTLKLQSDGKVLIVGGFIRRLNPNGTYDSTFDPGTGPNSFVNCLDIRTDGRVVLGGFFRTVNEVAQMRLAQLNSDGSLDSLFISEALRDGDVYSQALFPDGKIAIGGIFESVNGVGRNNVAKLNADGSVDLSFNPPLGVNGDVLAVGAQSDGKVLAGGHFSTANGIAQSYLARFNSDGSLDTGFEAEVNAPVEVFAIQSDGKILIGGNFTIVNGYDRAGIARLHIDGTLDNSFDPGSGANQNLTSIVIQPDGKVIVGGGFTTFDGVVRVGIARLNPNGSLDTGFNPTVNDSVTSLGIDYCNRIVIGGPSIQLVNGEYRNSVARLNPDGTVDLTFDPGTGANGLTCLTVQSDGRIVIGGNFNLVNGVTRNRIARLNSDGSVDMTFNPGGGPNATIFALTAQPDDQVLASGHIGYYNNQPHYGIVRVLP